MRDRWGAAFQTGGAIAAGLAAMEWADWSSSGNPRWPEPLGYCVLAWVAAAVTHGLLGWALARSDRNPPTP